MIEVLRAAKELGERERGEREEKERQEALAEEKARKHEEFMRRIRE